MERQGTFTKSADEKIRTSIRTYVNEANMDILINTGLGIIEALEDTSKIVTPDYILRRYITEHRDELGINWPEGCRKELDKHKVWSDDTEENDAFTHEIAEQVKEFAEEKAKNYGAYKNDFSRIKIYELISAKERGKYPYKAVSFYRLAFGLGMNIDDVQKLLLAWNGRSFNMHKPEDIAGYFCLSNAPFNRYDIYCELRDRIEDIFAKADEEDSGIEEKDRSGEKIKSNVTRVLRSYGNIASGRQHNAIPEDEMIRNLLAEVQNNAGYLKKYTGSNSDRNYMLDMIQDLSCLYRESDMEWDDGIPYHEYIMKKIRTDIGRMAEKEEERPPKAIAEMRGAFLQDMNNILKGISERDTTGKKYDSKNYRVRRIDIMFLTMFILSKYIDSTVTWRDCDHETYVPSTLNNSNEGRKILSLIDKFTDRYYGQIMSGKKYGDSYYNDKCDIYRKIVDYYMERTGFVGFYAAAEVDRFTLLLFLTDDPISTLGNIIQSEKDNNDKEGDEDKNADNGGRR